MIFLSNSEVLRWCYEPLFRPSLLDAGSTKKLPTSADKEEEWARSIIGGVGSQWTTVLCQDLVKEALQKLGRKNVRRPQMRSGDVTEKKYSPDLECDNYVYEVKGRNWSTTGTAGEKILGVPLKYGEVPRLYDKPLQVVLVGYQEYEAKHGFAFGDLLNSENQTNEIKESLAFFKQHGISYIGFTDILKLIGYPYGCWNTH